MSSVLHCGWQQALARIEGKAVDVVDASDVAGTVVMAGQCMLFKAIITHITIIKELAGVTILCSDKTGTLTTNKLTIDRDTAKLMPPSLVTTLSSSRCTHPALRIPHGVRQRVN